MNKQQFFQPPPNAKLPKKHKSKAKTALQVRNDEERNQQITDAVVTVLRYRFVENFANFLLLNAETLKYIFSQL